MRDTPLLDAIMTSADGSRRAKRLVLGRRAAAKLADELCPPPEPWPEWCPPSPLDVVRDQEREARRLRMRQQIIAGTGEGGLSTAAGVLRMWVDHEAEPDLVELS